MSVEKSIDLVATASSIEDAVSQAVGRAGLTIRGIRSFEVVKIEGTVDSDELEFRVLVRIWFVVKEQVHE
ncbi:MAG: dodecin family protein [Actinomycetota bacterium]|nr:dodecin family protein [Actinomycetota bacterium]